jgi:signal transduction histidine kinase
VARDEAGNPLFLQGVMLDVTGRKRAEEELKRRVGQLTALSSASQAVTASLELKPVLDNIVSLAREVTDADYASVVLADEGGNLVRGAEIEPDVPDVSARARPEGYTRWIVRSRQAAVVDDVAGDGAVIPPAPAGAPRTINPHFVATGLKSFVGLPLVARERLLGVLYLESSRPYHFHDQLPLLSTFANQAAIAIENARLFEAERAARERMQALSRQLVEVQEKERGYIARELHDGAGQALAYLMVTLGRLEQQAGRPEAVATQGVWGDLRRLAMDLRPPNLERLGLAAALRQHIEEFSRQHGQVVEFEAVSFDDVRLPPEVEVALYRIVQEALTNVARHAWARRVEVRLELNGDRVTAAVRDDGVGFEPGAGKQGGLGLVGMRERAEMLGGALVVESESGVGTAVSVEIPL